MNGAEKQILERALCFLKSNASDASENGCAVDTWKEMSKGKAVEDLEILQLLSDYNEKNAPKPQLLEVDVPNI